MCRRPLIDQGGSGDFENSCLRHSRYHSGAEGGRLCGVVFTIGGLAAVKSRRAADVIDYIPKEQPFKDFRDVVQVRYRSVIPRHLAIQPGLLQERCNRRDLESTQKFTITERQSSQSGDEWRENIRA